VAVPIAKGPLRAGRVVVVVVGVQLPEEPNTKLAKIVLLALTVTVAGLVEPVKSPDQLLKT
jgi:hypothetical protein